MHKHLVYSKEQVDHINRDKLDNRKENLRPATNALNGCNKGPQTNNTSGYKGVSWSTVSGKWSVEIIKDQKKHYLGLFEDREMAARMYNFWAAHLHEDFAWLNSIGDSEYSVISCG